MVAQVMVQQVQGSSRSWTIRRDEKQREERAAEKPRAGLLTDRKGRRVLVERFGQPAPIQQSRPEEGKASRHGRRRSPDRASGPRPRRPRGK